MYRALVLLLASFAVAEMPGEVRGWDSMKVYDGGGDDAVLASRMLPDGDVGLAVLTSESGSAILSIVVFDTSSGVVSVDGVEILLSDTTSPYNVRCCWLNDEELAVTRGGYYTPSGVVTVFNMRGAPLRSFGIPVIDCDAWTLSCIEPAPGGGLYCLVEEAGETGSTSQVLYRLENDGDLAWREYLGSGDSAMGAGCMSQTLDGGCAVANGWDWTTGMVNVYRVSPDGRFMWFDQLFLNGGLVCDPTDLLDAGTDLILSAVTDQFTMAYQTAVAVYDPSGQLRMASAEHFRDQSNSTCMTGTDEGAFVVCGWTGLNASFDSFDVKDKDILLLIFSADLVLEKSIRAEMDGTEEIPSSVYRRRGGDVVVVGQVYNTTDWLADVFVGVCGTR
jgi:hypothetical protein